MADGYLSLLQASTKDALINRLYNAHVAQYADYGTGMHPEKGGKRIPYIGWFWRDTDFVGKQISIGNCGDFIGVMENNKWGYPERLMTAEECDIFISYLDKAFAAKKDEEKEQMFVECWEWFQTLKIEGEQ